MSSSAASLRALVRDRDGEDCSICGQPIDFSLGAGTFMGPSLEHVVPVAAGGSKTDPANLRLAHARPCNSAKGAVYEDVDFAALRDPLNQAQPATMRHFRQIASAIAKAQAAARQPQGINPPQRLSRSEMDTIAGRVIRKAHESGTGWPHASKTHARNVRKAKTAAQEARGPWGGLIVVEERGPWGGIVTRNSTLAG
jgi:hypothetical protein